MRLYLVRHGKAESGGDEWKRPLTARGRAEVGRIAAHLEKAGCRVARVLHSGRWRARQTAEVLSAAIGPRGQVEEMRDGLQPEDTPDALAGAAAGWDEDVMVVGHQPFMGRAAAQFLCGDADTPLVSVKTASVICCERTGDGAWALCWMLEPSIVA